MNVEKDELNIYEVESLHQELLDEFKSDAIIIDMQKVNKIDMSVIQLLISTQKSCQENSKQFELKNVSSELSDIFKSCACDFLLGVANE
jgi:anti-anti-sigma factor